jgi:hypothetical protein
MNTNTDNDYIIDLHTVKIGNTSMDTIIFFASILLPFINETAIVLTKSKLPIFHNLYKSCIPDEIIEVLPELCKKNKDVMCSPYDTFRRLFIDAIAYLGIILNIGRSTLKYGYVTGVVNGFVLIICSIVFPNLYLGEIIQNIKQILHIEKPIMSILVGVICIIILIFVTKFLQDLSSQLFHHYRIDKINEPVVKNKLEQKIINYL